MKEVSFERKDLNKDEIIDELLEDKQIHDFIYTNDLPSDVIEDHLVKLLNYTQEIKKCEGCKGLYECKQLVKGQQPTLSYEAEQIRIYYKDCHYKLRRNQKQKQNKLISAMYMPKMIHSATLEDYDFKRSENRMEVHNLVTSFLSKYLNGDPVKGLYLYGQYQSGKTYTLAALANELIKHEVRVSIAYFPDLAREFKSRIGSNTVEELISSLKKVDVLMLDDIGGEAQSTWLRDEVLGPLLQHRLLDELPTFFSSNVTQKELAQLMSTNNQRAEKIKAMRIHSRINSLSDEVKM
ncbi:MAG: primosomal protein DnaI [Candidatus Izimaplasma sp.]|nr:primosomal protein DnaI [Candidatus Izimaplasma bacterium]